MSNKSDYNKERTDLHELLPEVLQSDVSKALIDNTFNRFLTKPELQYVNGYVGTGNPNALINRKIEESTLHRQAFQLQPMLQTTIGTVDHMYTYEDILNELTRLGVDEDRLPLWGNALQFNWTPPIDLDKLIRYNDYYWFDPDDTTSNPQYITMRNICNTAQSRLDYYGLTLQQYGNELNIVAISPTENTITVDGIANEVFVAGYTFFTTSTTNSELSSTWWTTVSSSVDGSAQTTTITVSQTITNPLAEGILSLQAYEDVLRAERDCICYGSSGWDTTQWDDNQVGTLLWNTALLASITLASAPVGPTLYDLWFDTNTDELKQWDGAIWDVVQQSFSSIVAKTVGIHNWDESIGCGHPTNQWIEQNHWVHRTLVTNFSIAKRAELPIIEYDAHLELTSWTFTDIEWKYRSNDVDMFAATVAQPTVFELVEFLDTTDFVYAGTNDSLTFDTMHGDLTDIFVPGYTFNITDGITTELVTVDYSTYGALVPGGLYSTVVEFASAATLTPIITITPVTTSQGDVWSTYHKHWLYVGKRDTVPTAPQPFNIFADPTDGTLVADTNYDYRVNQFAQIYYITAPSVTNFVLDAAVDDNVLLGSDDIRVYINDIRQYGNYTEDGATTVTGITFDTATIASDTVRIEVGPATMSEIGLSLISVRDVEDDITWDASPVPTDVSLLRYKKADQVKTALNQYPLFDMYEVDGTPANKVSSLFAFKESAEYPSNTLMDGRRIVRIDKGRDYEFEQFLIDADNGPMYTYRNYQLATDSYWFDTDDVKLYTWDGLTWDSKKITDEHYVAPITSTSSPWIPWKDISGTLWINPTTLTLFESIDTLPPVTGAAGQDVTLTGDFVSSFTVGQEFTVQDTFGVELVDGQTWTIEDVNLVSGNTVLTVTEDTSNIGTRTIHWLSTPANFTAADPTVQTIWKKGLNKEEYVPQQVDWIKRTEAEYTTEQDLYIQAKQVADPSLTYAAAYGNWLASQKNVHSETGEWIGDWEIADQLYFNNSHENRKCLRLTELHGHFDSIIKSQPKPPGFIGVQQQLYSLIYDVNYGLGGIIKEYNDSYDTMLSSVNVNNVTPISLIEFAQSQYENSLTTIRELFVRDAIGYLTSLSTETLLDPSAGVVDATIEQYELNDSASLIFGDSSTYNDDTDIGIKNWIITLPYIGVVDKVHPDLIQDSKLGINQVIHHDGHRSEVALPSAEKESIIRKTIATADTRTGLGTLGLLSNVSYPNTFANFLTEYTTTGLVAGVYWYHVTSVSRTLYRFIPTYIQTTAPTGIPPEGSFWYDTTNDLLKERISSVWVNTSGTVGDIDAAWSEINVDVMLAEIILEVETRLYDAAPTYTEHKFDFTTLSSEQTLLDELMEDGFSEHVHQQNIANPYSAQGIYDATDALTWNYVNSAISNPPNGDPSGIQGGTWQDVYEKNYGTPYPHLEPWKLQNYPSKPDWWDAEYEETDGTRRWIYNHATTTGMWENIRTGVIPVGEALPPGGILPTYIYFSVNIDDAATTDGYQPDELLPPYWNTSGTPFPAIVRSIFTSTNEVITPSLDYIFADSGIEEWKWRVSSQYGYDQLAAAYKMQPVRLIHDVFGIDFLETGCLQVNKSTDKVYSHTDTFFHGDIVDGDVFTAVGINQWYVNYNRYTNSDISSSDFRRLWVDWNAPLTYQLASFVDSKSLLVDNKNFDVTANDFDINMKRSPGIKDYWLDALKVSLIYAPPSRIQYDTQDEWKFELDTTTPTGRRASLFGVRRFEFGSNIGTNLSTLYTYNIINIDTVTRSVIVANDHTPAFQPDSVLTVADSTSNDGSYTVISSVYDSILDSTNIKVVESLSATPDGTATATYRTLPWVNGDPVYLTTTGTLPAPLEEDTLYYLIVNSNNTFGVSGVLANALANNPITLTSTGVGEHSIGQRLDTFTALQRATVSNTWVHYVIDERFIDNISPPSTIFGVQPVIDFIDGYAAFAKSEGFVFNEDGKQADPVTGIVADWQYETERFIDWAYTQRKVRGVTYDSFAATADDATDKFTFTGVPPRWGTGTQIELSTTGTLPSPIVAQLSYYIVRDAVDSSIFSLATSISNANQVPPVVIDLTSVGTGNIVVKEFIQRKLAPTIEINPFKNNIWLSHDQGVITNINEGPYKDIRTEQTLYDQYGRVLDNKDTLIFRQDTQSRITVQDEITNDVEIAVGGNVDPYNYLHLGGCHLFIDGYEHVLIFEDYAADGSLIYDSFLGVNTSRFDLQFDRQVEFTLRPNIGGYYLHEKQLIRNFESGVLDLQKAYGTYDTSETNPLTRHARDVLGYGGTTNYLDQLSVDPKAQFTFWRGMIQSKGSVNSVTAFINSRRFLGANVDEFWAYKVAEFGSIAEQSYPELNLTVNDSLINELKIHFLPVGGTVEAGFEEVTIETTDRWFEFPVQSPALEQLDPMYFDSQILSKETPTTAASIIYNDDAYHTTDVVCDDVIVTYFNGTDTVTLTDGVEYDQLSSRQIRFNLAPAQDIDILYPQLSLWTFGVSKFDISPAKIIDQKAGVVITEVPIWDPARGHHYHNAIHIVDTQTDNDTAMYTNSIDSNIVSTSPWTSQEFGTIWLDTSELGYQSYYDVAVHPDDEDRTSSWGKLADWASYNLYQWTESDVLPEEWNALAASEETNNSIPATVRKTGTVKARTYRRDREYREFTVTPKTEATTGSQTVTLDGFYGVTSEADLTGYLPSFTEGYAVAEEAYEVSDFTTDADVTDSLDGTYVTVSSPTVDYYFWFNTSGGAATDPAPAGKTLGGVINITTDDTADAVATALQGVINGHASFGATVLTNVVTVTAAVVGQTTDATNGDTGFTTPVSITTPGLITTYNILNGTYLPGEGMIAVTVNGVAATITEDSSTSFTITSALAEFDIIAAIITAQDYTASIGVGGIVPVFEISDITTVADVADNLNDKYFLISSPTDDYYFWFTVGIALPTDPAPVGYTEGGNIPLATNATADDVAIAVQAAIDVHLDFTATVLTNVVTVTAATAGDTPNADPGDSGFTTVTVANGITETFNIAINGDDAQTFGLLIIEINNEILGATASLGTNEIIITNDLTGITSTISISDGLGTFKIFDDLANFPGTIEPAIAGVDDVDTIYTIIGAYFDDPLADDDSLLLSSDDTLPEGLVLGTKYYVSDWEYLSKTFRIKDVVGGNYIELTDAGVGTLTAARIEWNDTWVEQVDLHEEIIPDPSEVFTVTHQLVPGFVEGAVVDVYISGVKFGGDDIFTVLPGSELIIPEKEFGDTTYGYDRYYDTLRVICPAYVPTSEELAFDPDVEDDGTTHVQYIEDIPYTEIVTIDSNTNVSTSTYYFWVGHKKVAQQNDVITMVEAEKQLENIPIPFLIPQNPITANGTTHYTQFVVRGMQGIVNDENRYTLRFTRDFTLRDDLIDSKYDSPSNDLHESWEIFREKQPYHIPRYLWDKLTEALAQRKLGGTIRVPSLENELYDNLNKTDTQYGFADGQTFVNSAIGIATVLADLNSPDNDFFPVNIESFFANNSFEGDTPTEKSDNIESAMNTLYNTFAFEHVNRIYFETLNDAFSLKDKYPDIFKTSMIALHGVRILETAGLFDD